MDRVTGELVFLSVNKKRRIYTMYKRTFNMAERYNELSPYR